MATKKLDVYLNKIFAGVFEQNSSGGGALSFTYDEKYLKSANAAPISASLPLRSEPFGNKPTKSFFSGLLPDEMQRDILAKKLKLSPQNVFALLAEVGRDCAGSIEILHRGKKPPSYDEGSVEPLSADGLYEILGKIYTNPMIAAGGSVRISLAGAQSKQAVFFDEKKKSLPQLVKEKPSTHILKPPILGLVDSSENEFFCMKMAGKVGLEVAEVFLKKIQDRPYLLVRRYDRTKLKGKTIRIHQEDFCQALGLPPESKYQGKDGGPGILDCLNLIEKNSSFIARDKTRFLQAVIFNYLIGNSDAHGKNFSFLHEGGKTRLAPLYDLLSAEAYEYLGTSKMEHNMAMKIDKIYDPDRLYLFHWHSIVGDTGTAKTQLNKELKSFATKVPKAALALQESLKKQGIESEIFTKIRNLIDKRSRRILGYF